MDEEIGRRITSGKRENVKEQAGQRFENKVVLVTGGSRGIGRAISEAFADEGAIIAINYRDNDQAANFARKGLSGDRHQLFKSDIATFQGCKDLTDQVLNSLGRIDILINNAGIHEKHPIDDTSYENWDRIFRETMDVNLMAPARLMYLCAQIMMKQGGGNIVNISSRGAFRGEPDQPAYGASKAGLNALSQSLAIKLAPFNIYVGVVAPCFVETDLTRHILDGPDGAAIRSQSPLERVALPEEVAHAALFLADPKSRFSTGTIVDVNGASYLR